MKKFYNLGTWCSTDSAVVHSLCVAAPIVCGGGLVSWLVFQYFVSFLAFQSLLSWLLYICHVVEHYLSLTLPHCAIGLSVVCDVFMVKFTYFLSSL